MDKLYEEQFIEYLEDKEVEKVLELYGEDLRDVNSILNCKDVFRCSLRIYG